MRQLMRILMIALAMVSSAGTRLAAEIRSDQAAALITFPYLVFDSGRGIDTALRISNTSADPVDVACFLENTTPHCTADLQHACASDADCAGGDTCDFTHHEVMRFGFNLTAQQPLGWRLSAGLATLPLPANSGTIPPVPEDPFVGALRCLVLDADGTPSDRNVLQGTANLERYVAASALLDAAAYNAVGQRAHAGAVDDDGNLTLGGPQAEYEGCPAALTLNHFYDGAIDPMRSRSSIFTELSVLPCAAELGRAGRQEVFSRNVVQFVTYNEFEQHFATSVAISAQGVLSLSALDTPVPDRSIFFAGVEGTLGGQTVITGVPGGLMAVALEKHQDTDGSNRVTTAAFNLHSAGERATAETVSIKLACGAGTSAGCRLACGAEPIAGCRTAKANSLRLRQGLGSRIAEVAWQWRKGQATGASEFGNPLQATDYAFCLYAGGAVATLHIPASSSRWAAARRGFTYTDRGGAADGVLKVVLRSSNRDHASAKLLARGDGVPPLGLTGGIPTPLIVQLLNRDGTCLQGAFDAGDVRENAEGIFKARARR